MSCRAARVTSEQVVQPFAWTACSAGAIEPLYAPVAGGIGLTPGRRGPGHGGPLALDAPAPPARHEPTQAEIDGRLAALEREAFTKGYAAGERAGMEAGAKRSEAMLRRVAQTLDELAALRQTMIRQTEGELVQLALTLARRVVRRELAQDADLIAAIAHVALEKLGGSVPATIRLHPEDYTLVMNTRPEGWGDTQVSVTADASVPRGGCLVESEFGQIDASLEAQFNALTRALLEEHSDVPATLEAPRG